MDPHLMCIRIGLYTVQCTIVHVIHNCGTAQYNVNVSMYLFSC